MNGILAVVQARMGSSRLNGKSMLPLAGVPLIEHVVRRVQAAKLVDKVVVATTDQSEDDVLAAHVESLGVDAHRGSAEDVLSRFFWASERYPDCHTIVRITADDYAKDPKLIDHVLTAFICEWGEKKSDMSKPQYMWLGGPTWPYGLDVEVFTRTALQDAYKNASSEYDREHVTPWLLNEFGVWMLRDDQRRSSGKRFTIDTQSDYEEACRIYDRLYKVSPLFGYDELLA